MEEQNKETCPVCRAGRKGAAFGCRTCGLYDEEYRYLPANPPVTWRNRILLFVQINPLPHSGKVTYNEALEEALRIFRHSEWAQWRDLPELRSDKFLQSLFADWCADNGFPLQEQAVRERLSKEEVV